jgi:hypothetical protein
MMPDPRPEEIVFVAAHMRRKSREDVYLHLPHDDPVQLSGMILRRAGVCWVEYHEGVPAAILGAWPMHPGVWSLFGFGTDHYGAVMGKVARHARRVMFPTIKATGAHRAQTMSPASHEDTHRWLRMLGGIEEGTLRGYGKNGEDVKLFAWTEVA